MAETVAEHSTACRPPKDTTYLAIGQDLFSINEYILSQFNASLHHGSLAPMSTFSPAAAMVYTDLTSLRGLMAPIDYGSGVEYADGIINSLFLGQGVGLQIGLWLSGSKGCHKINQGRMDANLEKLVGYLEGSQASKIFLRLGYEFDNPSFGYSSDPVGYADAFRYIVTYCRRHLSPESIEKVKFVWHSWASPMSKGLHLNDFYPGNDVVDWVGISIFQQLYSWAPSWAGTIHDIEQVVDFAQNHSKPIMIAESTPFGGIYLSRNVTGLADEMDAWESWFEKVLRLIDRFDISMWSYINCNWEAQPMWHNVGFGDTRLVTDAKVMHKWREQILGLAQTQANRTNSHTRTFLMAGSLENCGNRIVESESMTMLGRSQSRMNQEPVIALIDDHTMKSGALRIIFFASCITCVLGGIFMYVKRKIHSKSHQHDQSGSGEMNFANEHTSLWTRPKKHLTRDSVRTYNTVRI